METGISSSTSQKQTTEIIMESTSTQTPPSPDIKLYLLTREHINTSTKIQVSNFKLEKLRNDKEKLWKTITSLYSKIDFLETQMEYHPG